MHVAPFHIYYTNEMYTYSRICLSAVCTPWTPSTPRTSWWPHRCCFLSLFFIVERADLALPPRPTTTVCHAVHLLRAERKPISFLFLQHTRCSFAFLFALLRLIYWMGQVECSAMVTTTTNVDDDDDNDGNGMETTEANFFFLYLLLFCYFHFPVGWQRWNEDGRSERSLWQFCG